MPSRKSRRNFYNVTPYFYFLGLNSTFFQGDIVLTADMLRLLNETSSTRRRRAIKKDLSARWTNGVVPFTIDKRLSKFLTLKFLYFSRNRLGNISQKTCILIKLLLTLRTNCLKFRLVCNENLSDKDISLKTFVFQTDTEKKVQCRARFNHKLRTRISSTYNKNQLFEVKASV